MNTVYLLLGSNEGNKLKWLHTAIRSIEQNIGTIAGRSSIYETAAWGLEDQPSFNNMVLEVVTSLSALEVLQQIQQIEKECGRQRDVKWGQRTLDIDILFFNNDVIQTETLSVPHPFLQDRRFTLEPLNEIAPLLMHPVLKKNVAQLLEECPDLLTAEKLAVNIR